MLKRLVFLFITTVFSFSLFAQENDSISSPGLKNVYSPTIGLGIGMLKYYGDITDDKYGNPLISRIGYDLHVKQQINSYLTVKFYVLFGQLGANERTLERNLNFQSKITTGGFEAVYNFDHILPERRVINPYVSLGIESVEFHSKTDLYDSFGNKYNYWSDGSIRNLAENDPNAASAVIIQRDYIYETDLREANFDNFGKYPERTFAIPVGAGAKMHLTQDIEFSIGTSLHMTFSDLVDNVTEASSGERIGDNVANSRNDRFLFSSVSLSYNFKTKKKEEVEDFFEEEIDYLAYDDADEDGDGVIDFIDECPWTPADVEVDEKGCPLDMDKDFVPNYKDDELQTRDGAPVTPNGVELTDTMIHMHYLAYMDSTGMFAETETRLIAHDKPKKKTYKVQIGAFSAGVESDLVDKFLSIPDIELTNYGDTLTVFTVGNYDNLPEAIKRKIKATEEGIEGAVVVVEENDGTLKSVGDEANNMVVDNNTSNNLVDELITDDVVFRIQLGAFSKKQPDDIFNGLTETMEIKGDDGLYKYVYNQSFTSMEDAARSKVNLLVDYSLEDAFIVAYQGGKRISLKDAGVKSAPEENDIKENNVVLNESEIKFKVQIGMYKNQLPTEVLTKFMELENVEQTDLENDLTRYTSGSFTDYSEAEQFKDELIANGLGGAFVIALQGDQLISVKEARELLEK